MKAISKMFLQGLLLILPAVITVAALWWLFARLEPAMASLIHGVGLERLYFPGMGILLAVVLILLLGLAARMYLVRKVVSTLEAILDRIPFVKSIYGAVKDFTDFLNSPGKGQGQQVVMVDLLENNCQLLGLVTREDLCEVGPMFDEQTIAVYLPMSYQLGGFTVMLPRERVKPVPMSIEDAMRFAMTAGVARPGAAPREEKAIVGAPVVVLPTDTPAR